MKSSFFYSTAYKKVAQKIKDVINAEPDFLSRLTASSPRAVGDAIQSLVEEKFESVLGSWCAEYSASFARRAMEDLAFKDKEGIYCVVDVKTHRLDTQFNMPALVSVKRLARFYEDDTNVFAILMITYEMIDTRLFVKNVFFCPIEFLSWNCLTVGALGWGQIQIVDSNAVKITHGQSRKNWMLSLCDRMLEFYPKEISKIHERESHFGQVKSYWYSKNDIWAT